MSLSVEENDQLTRVGPGTPCGEMMRRYWHPIGFSSELKGRPIRRRLLGEDLVVFRDDQGRVGLLALRCHGLPWWVEESGRAGSVLVGAAGVRFRS